MATLGNTVNATTVGSLLVGIANDLKGQYYDVVLAKLDELQQNVGSQATQIAAGITDSNQQFQINAMVSALQALKACFENGLAQPGFNIPQFCDQLIGTSG
jgi:hypothetical protein